MSSSLVTSAVNPNRLRKTAAKAAHNTTLQANIELPKGRRHRERAVEDLKKNHNQRMTETGIDVGSFILYFVISMIFYGAVIGWFFNIPIIEVVIYTPLRYIGGIIMFPFNLIRSIVSQVFLYVGTFVGVIAGQENYMIPNPMAKGGLEGAVKSAQTLLSQATGLPIMDDEEEF